MRFFVTYAAMDGELANPFWHAFIMLSYWSGEGSKIQVTNAWGFYAAETTTPDSLYRTLKKSIGLDIDLQGNHGILRIEELRYLDVGHGLRGLTIEISFEQFCQLKTNCKQQITDQEQAVKDVRERLAVKNKAFTSKAIFQKELRSAAKHGRSPRLKPFEFKLCLDKAGLSFNNSYSCKSMALDLLRGIGIKEAHLKLLTLNETAKAIPYNSGYLEPIFLHSRGPGRPEHKHVSTRTNHVSFFRTWKDKQVKLFWSLPPQLIITESHQLESRFILPMSYENKVKQTIKKLQALERIIVNTGFAGTDRLIAAIQQLYDSFAVINHDNSCIDTLKSKFKNVERFIADLHEAILDDWDDDEEVTAIVAQLPTKKQKEICKLIRKPYLKWSQSAYIPEEVAVDQVARAPTF